MFLLHRKVGHQRQLQGEIFRTFLAFCGMQYLNRSLFGGWGSKQVPKNMGSPFMSIPKTFLNTDPKTGIEQIDLCHWKWNLSKILPNVTNLPIGHALQQSIDRQVTFHHWPPHHLPTCLAAMDSPKMRLPKGVEQFNKRILWFPVEPLQHRDPYRDPFLYNPELGM